MERLYNSSKSTNKDVFLDPSHRMSQRPSAIKSGEGLGFQDIGSSLLPPKPRVTYGKASKSKYKPAPTFPNKQRRTLPNISDDESDDELLLSSQNSMDATPPSKRVVKGRKPDTPSDEEEIIRANGRVLVAHPLFKPSTLNAVKGLRFKKYKDLPAADAETEVPPPSSSLTDSQDVFKSISDDIETDDIEILDDPLPGDPSSSRQKPSKAHSTRRSSPSSARAATRWFPDAKDSSTSKPPPPPVKETPRSPTKPRPRPYVVISHKGNRSPESTPRPAAQRRGLPLRNKSPELPANADGKRTVKKPPLSSSSRREPQEFLVSLKAKENVSDGTWSGEASSTKTKKGISRAATFVQTPKPIPLPSPLGTRQVSRGTTFPNLSPLSASKNKGKARAKSSDEDINSMDGPGKRSGPKPFPMSSQMLAGIDLPSKPLSIRSPKSTKRTSSDDSGAEQGRSAKKRKDSRSGVLDILDYLHEPMEDDSIELGYARDPAKMCPYCDEELPSHPTPFLQHLLTTARKKSVSDPRPRNRGGLKAPLTIYISVCQRHRFESHQLPIAAEKGWPETIDFTKVPARVKKMKKELEGIILDKDNVSDAEDLDPDDESRGPRSKSVFWREIKKAVKKQGSRAVVGVKGQFASFEKTQPGYYGEQGSVIIHQTLFDLFPPSTFDASLIAPLAPAEFIQRILVPEAAVRLIAQDLCLDIEDAIVTLRESAQYGVAMFPDTGENKRKGAGGVDDDEMDVADKIVMERARARRKELAEEEKVEKEMLEEERAARRAKAQESRREKALERAQRARQTRARAEEKAEVSEASATRRGTVTDDTESDAMSVDSLTSRRSARIGKKEVRGDGGKAAVRATPQLDGSDSGSVEFVSGSRRKASSRRNGTRERSVDPNTGVKVATAAPRERKKPFGGFALLDNDGERESTPRPARRRTTDAGAAKTEAVGSVLPLQVARNRPGASAPTARDSSRTSRTDERDDTDSDASNVHQRLVRPPIKKGGPSSLLPWLYSSQGSSTSDSQK